MADNNKTTVILDLDNKEFVKKLKDSLGLMGELGKSDSLKGLFSTFTKIGAVAGVAGAAILAVKTALDMATEAEHINQINNSFEALAKSAGLAGNEIKEKLVHAAQGLADDTDLLQAANKAIVAMGSNAAKIPESMELARKATVLFGGDLIQNFENINTALASGNTRMLKQYGIIIDQKKAIDDYAKSLGVSANYLSDTAKKQAVMNAALEEGKKKFEGIDESNLKTTNNLKRISVAFGEIKEIAILAWDAIAGPTVSSAVEKIANSVRGLATTMKATFGKGEEKEAAHKQLLEDSIKKYEALIAQEEKYGNEFTKNNEQYKGYLRLLEQNKKELDSLNQKEEEAGMLAMKRSAHEFASSGGKPKGEDKPDIDYEKLKEGRQKFSKELEDIRMKRYEADLQFSQSELEAEAAFKQKNISMEKEAKLQKQEIEKQAADLGLQNSASVAEALANIDKTLKDKQLDNLRELDEARIRSLENYQNRATTAADGIAGAFAKGSAQARQDLTNWGKTGQMVFDSVKSRSVSAFKAMGDGSKSASEAMRGFVLGTIGDTATAKGTEMMLAGIWPPNPAAIAGGGALIALGAALSSQAGGAGGGSISTGGAGGGVGGSAASIEQSKPEPEIQAKKAVSVNIHGSYYETEQTRTRLMDMIRESGDFTDFNLTQIGQSNGP